MDIPLCPVTGEPASRHVQWISTRLLTDLWRIEFGVDVRPSFGTIDRLGLWESPCGLYFVDPPREGTSEFYERFYARMGAWGLFPGDPRRVEYELAAKKVAAGAKVLDVGCGAAHFRRYLAHAQYTGLDPNFASKTPDADVRGETLEDHVSRHAGSYDAVCAFQVLEHLSNPAAFFMQMVQAAKPGGLIIIGVPLIPSAITRIPNFLVNAPPHHLTWWTEPALAALAARAGAQVESIEEFAWSRADAPIYWIDRCSLIKCKDAHFRGAWSWHAAAALGMFAGLALNAILPVPKKRGAGLLLMAKSHGQARSGSNCQL
ncbi:MAG TPA: class I SAM-dependent methyltransferase [Beijerinckia sp.]|jgi:SAM-dependent methyltransferase|nr:class I SAM-dependent methyltransferase [Beijerinckia sp.]